MKTNEIHKDYKIELANAAAIIMSGLLSTGHYTHIRDPENGMVLDTYDNGEDWKENGLLVRFQYEVLDDTKALLKDLICELEADFIEDCINQSKG
tara:strand:+ start:112 stop:396 length:285 start_codon:yes stop_codon:yes gene_type:complete